VYEDHAHLTLYRVDQKPGLLLWALDDGDIPRALKTAFSRGVWHEKVPIVLRNKARQMGVKETRGWWLDASSAAHVLSSIAMNDLSRVSTSVGIWALASKFVMELVYKEYIVPTLQSSKEGPWSARWRVAPVQPNDRTRLIELASHMPGVARAIPSEEGRQDVYTAPSALQLFMDAAADGLVRAPKSAQAPRPGEGVKWAMRLASSLAGPDPSFQPQGLADEHLPMTLGTWIASAVSFASGSRPTVAFRLEEPVRSNAPWILSYHAISPTNNLRVSVADYLAGKEAALEAANSMHRMEESLLGALAGGGKIFLPIKRSQSEKLPACVELDGTEAWEFLTAGGLNLERAGHVVEVPSALSKVGRRRVRARMRVGVDAEGQGAEGSKLLSGMMAYSWEASLGDDALTLEEFKKLAAAKAPLVKHRGKWVAVDPEDVARLQSLIEDGHGMLDASEALRLALAGQTSVPGAPGISADVISEGAVQNALDVLEQGLSDDAVERTIPAGIQATLRPYQIRGFSWLYSVSQVGFGACLADDMGLGKTLQTITLMQAFADKRQKSRFIVVCPTSVIGNWSREIRRFAPGLRVVIHHGASRPQKIRALQAKLNGDEPKKGTVLITSYALVRGDQDVLSKMTFDLLALDEAQNIKNPDAAQSHAVRKLSALRRIALTGTPVENRLMELWSILDFLNPGLLGSRATFKRVFAMPVERYGDEDAATRLRRVTAPFILRRLKTDPEIAPELPDKGELTRYCPMTPEQAALYQATLDKAMEEISGLEQSMQRRGKILALITALKQICNHPSQYLEDGDPDPSRSGKLYRFLELFRDVRHEDGQALIFTQYRVMGEMLSAALTRQTSHAIPFLHGGLSRTARENIVQSFQSPNGPPAMVISLRAGGTGLNLTRANHIFHYDRWWNPAVEDQATDRAYRIGQTRDVTVHQLVTQGSMEEQIHQILRDKRNLADRVVGSGETWLSELDDLDLHELVALSQDTLLEDVE
jgi:superfamily II DNA or RNA helicase